MTLDRIATREHPLGHRGPSQRDVANSTGTTPAPARKAMQRLPTPAAALVKLS
jgi:DNA-binding transcriptional regulator YhcF (GntR family)